MTDAKTRLAIAGRIAAGAMANPKNMEMRDFESKIAAAAWMLAGKLCSIAAQYEAESQPANAAATAKAYAKAGG